MPSAASFQPHQHHSTTITDISRQIKISLIIKNNLTSAAQRLAVSFVVSATATPTEICAIVNARSVGVIGFKILIYMHQHPSLFIFPWSRYCLFGVN